MQNRPPPKKKDLFLWLSRRQLQIEGVQFPAEAVKAETELDALVIDREIPRAGEEGVAGF